MECEECKNGIHKHMEVTKEPWFKDAPRHEQLDAIDCKNPCGDNDQCVCHLWREAISSE